jgi:hypothetical protein
VTNCCSTTAAWSCASKPPPRRPALRGDHRWPAVRPQRHQPRGGGLTAPALTEKDKADIKLAAEMDLDYLAVSFPRDASDMEYARKLRDEAGGSAWLVAKIERAEAVADDETLDG